MSELLKQLEARWMKLYHDSLDDNTPAEQEAIERLMANCHANIERTKELLDNKERQRPAEENHWGEDFEQI